VNGGPESPPRSGALVTRACTPRAVVCLILLIAVNTALSGCGVATPLCDEAATLADSGQLSQATEKYAEASQHGEGECADKGLSAAAARYTDAYVNIARGRKAEDAHDLNAATAAYRAALAFDADNAAARDGLARLNQPVPIFRAPSQPPVATVPPAAPADFLGRAFSIAATALFCTILILLAWLMRQWRREPLATAHQVLTAVDVARSDLDTAAAKRSDALHRDLQNEHREDLAEAQRRLLDAISTVQSDLARARIEIEKSAEKRWESLQHHLDQIIDFVGDTRRVEGKEIAYRFTRPESSEGG
jgi:hypothetical protein